MFSKILIANRGEIACRIIRTAKRLGIRTVAVYFRCGRRGAASQACRRGGAYRSVAGAGKLFIRRKDYRCSAGDRREAIHPGYGFLSENPDFVEAVEKAGLVFIGPSAASIRAMGLKDAAKRLMEKAGVPVVPGYHGDNQDAAFLADEAEDRLSGAHQGVCRRRRQGDAAR